MDELCRCCAKKSICLFDIYGKGDNQLLNPAQKLKIFHNFTVEAQSMLSTKICDECLLNLEIAYNFFQNLIKAQDSLKSVWTQLQPKKIRLLLPKDNQIIYTCVKCSSSYDNKSIFEEHMKQHLTKKKFYRCYTCLETLTTPKELRDHISSHTVGDVCKFCNTFFSDKVSLDYHIGEMHKNSKYVCLKCSQEFHSRRMQALHMNGTHQGILFYCGECQQCEYKGIDELNSHKKELHEKNTNTLLAEDNTFMVEEFLEEFFLNQYDSFQLNDYFDTLSFSFDAIDCSDKENTEKENCSDSEVRYRCPHCPEGFDKQISLKVHLAHKHDIETLICTSCDSSFNRIEDFKKHRLEHKIPFKEKNGKDLMCQFCGVIFPTRDSLNVHRKDAHSGDKLHYYCFICNKYFQTLRGLSYHQKTHSGIKKYSCPYCEQKFALDVGLSAHVKTVHSKIKPNICKLCDGRFATTDHLRKHVTSFHQKERNYVCNICGKGFAQMSHLKQHTQTHTGERPFQCTACDKKFFKRVELRNHIKTHSENDVHPISTL